MKKHIIGFAMVMFATALIAQENYDADFVSKNAAALNGKLLCVSGAIMRIEGNGIDKNSFRAILSSNVYCVISVALLQEMGMPGEVFNDGLNGVSIHGLLAGRRSSGVNIKRTGPIHKVHVGVRVAVTGTLKIEMQKPVIVANGIKILGGSQ